ncbi:NADPH-dependent FMN reductase [Caloranaerobacter azorensis H53214]|uniref:NADPH-dependent FMN reductase n=1 Tax=Caloranaerobacter azorensis H53214 TaxID=1156417 RepID=A0A096CV73_9FIRM|nr:flavodoxin family protein [Caloranaerobacter azorensis]KGG80444.1 NADPH-dependent FMN reductase [Caloranaerobacter azorensis H53214]
MKKVLAVMGSPRKHKNTDILLDSVLEGIKKYNADIRKIYLKDLNINLCTGCYYCSKTGNCFINDDMNELYREFNESDGIIIASPLYFNTVSSLTKIMIDRCQVYWSSKFILKNPSIDVNKNRIGMFIATGGAPYKEGHFDGCIPVIDFFFKAINTRYKYNLLISDTDRFPIWEREGILNEGFNLGVKFFE